MRKRDNPESNGKRKKEKGNEEEKVLTKQEKEKWESGRVSLG